MESWLMNKIAIIGSGGSGKSTLARELGALLNIPVYHLDSLYWQPGWVKTERSDWLQLQRNLCSQDQWIIDGNYQSSLDVRLTASDTVIFLDVNRVVCIYRAMKRMLDNAPRPDRADGCNERFDFNFIKFLWCFPKDSKPVILKKLSDLPDSKKVIVAKSGKQILQLVGAE